MVQNKFNVVVFVVLGGAVFATPKVVNTSTMNLLWGHFGRVGGLAGGSK